MIRTEKVHWALTTAEQKLQAGHRAVQQSASSCASEDQGLKETRLPPRACPTPHLLREKKDMEQRQEFRQLILYLKNNKQPDFTY